MGNVSKKFQIDAIAATDDEMKLLSCVFRGLYPFCEFEGGLGLSSFIEEDDHSFFFFERFDEFECFLDLDIFGIGVRDGLQDFEGHGFSEAFLVLED